MWDTAHGIVSANANDPDASGFIVNQNTTTNINVNNDKYIFLTIA